MADDARQKMINAAIESRIASASVNRPEKSNGAKTNAFLIHCFGRSKRNVGDKVGIIVASTFNEVAWLTMVSSGFIKINFNLMPKTVLYVIFAAIATSVNLVFQELASTLFVTRHELFVSMFAGTLA
ncbi:hypothetical protein, partial [Vibrio paucivorans]